MLTELIGDDDESETREELATEQWRESGGSDALQEEMTLRQLLAS